MAKLAHVISEIVAEAHRLRVLVERYTEPGDEEHELARSLVHDLESVNLPALVNKYQRRGATIARYQYRNESRNKHKRRVRARLERYVALPDDTVYDW